MGGIRHEYVCVCEFLILEEKGGEMKVLYAEIYIPRTYSRDGESKHEHDV